MTTKAFQKNLLPKFSCDYTATPKRCFEASSAHVLGTQPRTVELCDETQVGVTHLNPIPEDADTFVRGASGVQFNFVASKNDRISMSIAQDSRRKIARVDLTATAAEVATGKTFSSHILAMQPPASEEDLTRFEDDTIDYCDAVLLHPCS